MGRPGVENGTHRTRPSPGPIRTDMSRTWISILNSTQGTLQTIGPFSTHPRTLTFRPILTPSAFLSQKSSLISKHALPQDGVKTSLELLETTRWFSRRSTYQLSATTSARPPSGPPDSAGGSSSTIRLSALAELTARTPAREMVEAPLSARASLTQLPTSRLVSLPGVSVVARTTHLVSMPLCPRVSAGLTTP